MPKTICIDFDGVLHGYQSKWQGHAVIGDPPVPGAIEWLKHLLADPGLEPMIYSSRSKWPEGVTAMRDWLRVNGITEEELGRLPFPTQKPAAFLTIDDRAYCFQGSFPTAEAIHNFRTWQQ